MTDRTDEDRTEPGAQPTLLRTLPLPGPGDIIIEGLGVRPADPPSFARIPLREPGPARDIPLIDPMRREDD